MEWTVSRKRTVNEPRAAARLKGWVKRKGKIYRSTRGITGDVLRNPKQEYTLKPS